MDRGKEEMKTVVARAWQTKKQHAACSESFLKLDHLFGRGEIPDAKGPTRDELTGGNHERTIVPSP